MSRFMMQALGRVRPLSFDGGRATPPLLASVQTTWAGVPFELHHTRPVESKRDSGPPHGEHSLLLVVGGAMDVVYSERGQDRQYRCVPGTVSIHSAQERPVLKRVSGSGEMFVARLSAEWRERLAINGAQSLPDFQAPLPPDATLHQLATTMCTEVSRGATTGSLFAESLSLAFLSYALERVPTAPVLVRGTLGEVAQRRLRRYVEERLHEDLSVNDLAQLCGLQARQFSTLFRRAFGRTPYRYVIERRVARGVELLTRSGMDVGEVAERVGFSSASHFATEFRRTHGVSPRAFVRYRRGIAES